MAQRKRGHLLATLLFTDIVGSTQLADELGDRRWRELLARHHAVVRRYLKLFSGRELDTAGDGFFAAFTSPADALRCACHISDAVRDLGIEIRAGLHMGEAEMFGAKLSGVAVHIAARTMATAGPDEVMVTSVVKDLVSGGGFGFTDRGLHQLKGIPGDWHLYTVTAVDGRSLPAPLQPAERAERLASIQPPVVSRRVRKPLVAAGVVTVIILIGAFVLIASSNRGGGQGRNQAGRTPGESPSSIPALPDSVLRIDPSSDKVLADIKVGAQPLGIAFSGGYVWVVNREDRSISRIDPQTNAILSTQGGLTGPCNLAADPDGGVWVTNCLAPPYVVAHMSRGGELGEPVEMPDVPAGVAFGAGDVWVALLPPGHPRGTVVRVDPTLSRIVHTFRVGRGAEYIDFNQGTSPGEGTLWVGNVNDDTVSKIDARYNIVEATIPVGSSPFQVTVGGGFVWVNSRGARWISKIDPVGDRLVAIVEGVRGTMAALGNDLWVADPEAPKLWRVDMATGRVVAEFHLDYTGFIATGAGSIWISAPASFDDQCCP